jgi:tryptophan synthase alpha chain
MTRGGKLEARVREARARKPLLLMTHTVAGYPSIEANREMLRAMDSAGVDLVELQLPFSEPIADGPVFSRANQEAIENRVSWDDYFALLRSASELRFPALFMGYANSILQMGEERFSTRLAESGASGFIAADLPPEEARSLNERARGMGIDPILLMTPTSSPERLSEIAAQASGFVYCVARKGVTGKPTDLTGGVEAFMARCRKATRLPLALGFGIKTAADVRAVRGLADIAIVGTACLEAWEQSGPDGYRRFLASLAAATV